MTENTEAATHDIHVPNPATHVAVIHVASGDVQVIAEDGKIDRARVARDETGDARLLDMGYRRAPRCPWELRGDTLVAPVVRADGVMSPELAKRVADAADARAIRIKHTDLLNVMVDFATLICQETTGQEPAGIRTREAAHSMLAARGFVA